MGRSLALALLAGEMLAGMAFAQVGGTISDGSVQFVRTTSSFDATPAADLFGVSSVLGQDHLFEHGWWFRVVGDSAEQRLGVPDSEVYASPTSTITWNNVAGRGLFSAEETIVVIDQGSDLVGDGGVVIIDLVLTNLSASTPLFISLFHLADLDVNGSTNDSAVFAEYPRLIEVTDPSGNWADYAVTPPAAYLVRPFGATSVREVLNDGGTTDFDNSGLPFAAGDITLGWQVDRAVAPSSQGGMHLQLAVDVSLRCSRLGDGIFCDAFESDSFAFWTSVGSFGGG